MEDVSQIHSYDVTVVGVPFDGGCTYRAGSRFGPQAIRRMTGLYAPPYQFEHATDLLESISMCDVGDVYTIPANIEKTLDQVTNAIGYIASTKTFPLVLGGDHSIGYATIRGIASVTSKNIGIIHFDRHADMQETDMDERMHSTPYFHATNLPNVRPQNLVQIGIGGWQVPRPAINHVVRKQSNVFTVDDIDDLGLDKVVEIALAKAWEGCDAVYMSFDIDVLDPAVSILFLDRIYYPLCLCWFVCVCVLLYLGFVLYVLYSLPQEQVHQSQEVYFPEMHLKWFGILPRKDCVVWK